MDFFDLEGVAWKKIALKKVSLKKVYLKRVTCGKPTQFYIVMDVQNAM